MGTTSMQMLQRFLSTLQRERITAITEEKLDRLIKIHLGADPRTVRKYKELMQEFGMIQKAKDGKIRINYNWNII